MGAVPANDPNNPGEYTLPPGVKIPDYIVLAQDNDRKQKDFLVMEKEANEKAIKTHKKLLVDLENIDGSIGDKENQIQGLAAEIGLYNTKIKIEEKRLALVQVEIDDLENKLSQKTPGTSIYEAIEKRLAPFLSIKGLHETKIAELKKERQNLRDERDVVMSEKTELVKNRNNEEILRVQYQTQVDNLTLRNQNLTAEIEGLSEGMKNRMSEYVGANVANSGSGSEDGNNSTAISTGLSVEKLEGVKGEVQELMESLSGDEKILLYDLMKEYAESLGKKVGEGFDFDGFIGYLVFNYKISYPLIVSNKTNDGSGFISNFEANFKKLFEKLVDKLKLINEDAPEELGAKIETMSLNDILNNLPEFSFAVVSVGTSASLSNKKGIFGHSAIFSDDWTYQRLSTTRSFSDRGSSITYTINQYVEDEKRTMYIFELDDGTQALQKKFKSWIKENTEYKCSINAHYDTNYNNCSDFVVQSMINLELIHGNPFAISDILCDPGHCNIPYGIKDFLLNEFKKNHGNGIVKRAIKITPNN